MNKNSQLTIIWCYKSYQKKLHAYHVFFAKLLHKLYNNIKVFFLKKTGKLKKENKAAEKKYW